MNNQYKKEYYLLALINLEKRSPYINMVAGENWFLGLKGGSTMLFVLFKTPTDHRDEQIAVFVIGSENNNSSLRSEQPLNL